MHYVAGRSVYNRVKKFKKMITGGVAAAEIVSCLKSAEDVRALLMSERLISLPVAVRDEVISMIVAEFKGREEENLALFTGWALASQEREYRAAQRVSRKWSIEAILSGYETFLVRMQDEGVSPDGNRYPDYIVDSQYLHLLSSLGVLLYFVSKEGLPYKVGAAACKGNDFYNFVNGLCRYESLRSFVLEVANGNNIPVNISKISPIVSAKGLERFVGKGEYFLEWYSDDWRKLEIYRDLSYQFNYHHEGDVGAISSVMTRSGAGRYVEGNGGALYFDLSKEVEFEREFNHFKISQHLAPLYGDGDVCVSFNGIDFSLDALIKLCVSIREYAEGILQENSQRVSQGKKARVSRMALDRLLDVLEVTKVERSLVELLSADLSGVSINMDVPLFKIDEGFVIVPSHVLSLCFEKVIDKILSRKDVVVKFSNGMKKGLLFEQEVFEVISSSGRKISRIKRQSDKGVPEIDGIFDIDSGSVAICEIKSSIKPEGRRDAYGFAENHLLTALEQLDVRFDFLSSVSPEKIKDYGFSLEGKEVTLFVVTNHNYFLGLEVRTPKGRPAFVVDINYLRDVLVRGVIPTWKLQGNGEYLRCEVPVRPGGYRDALMTPLMNLSGMRRDTIQFQEVGVGIFIYKSPLIDKRSYYPEELWGFVGNGGHEGAGGLAEE
ncbi:hypothetical protein RDJ20_12800 [Pseudomonas aeruginosa]|uniref:hypothetical protein n=1 Tax=Pseudomonas aeruginosa TaxID=287 RepID=UPI00249E7298|nr:hypothetical protein [Pseudomonas aeruginosa]MDI3652372.1 hypothetical protein [Pseudomonas aeruginosa]WRH84909.1 hypothetical protein RDJ20_12800 [Pseudomonas aeruginosa]